MHTNQFSDDIPRFSVIIGLTVLSGDNDRTSYYRTVELPFIPRVGDYLSSDDWGLTFADEGAEVLSIGLDLSTHEVHVWIKDLDLQVYAEAWDTEDEMFAACCRGFTKIERL
jgi:hypothetical protein